MKNLTSYWAVMLDETGCEFGRGVEAESREAAYAILREDFPESRCAQLESPEDTREREAALYHAIADEDGDYEPPEECCDVCGFEDCDGSCDEESL